MENDSIIYDSLEVRPLPQWLTDQRDGLNQYQPEILEMKKDPTLNRALISTGITILLALIFLTVYMIRKNKIKF
ncbi:MAG TPA: hypothetical protein VFD91_08565 [Mariniphaga sp.]|nr:hypothetical protein [Mariniphaga sp.]